MLPWILLLTTTFADLPLVEVETLKGETHRGPLTALSSTAATVRVGETETKVPAEELLEVRWQAAPSTLTLPPMVATLADGSRLSCTDYSTSRAQAKLDGPYGTLEIPVGQVAHVRFLAGTDAQTSSWLKYVERAERDDALVTQAKDGSIDRLTGVVGDVSAEVQFLIDGEELKVKREKLHGIIYRQREAVRKPASTLTVALLGGDFLNASSATWDGEKFEVSLLAGASVTIPPDRLRSIDYSGGKVKYLSADAPRDITAISIWGNVKVPEENLGNYFRRDRTRHSPTLSLDRKQYRRGLFFFPDTTVRYRIGGDYTRFKALAGIDDREASDDYGDAKLTIQGDTKVLLEASIKRGEAPIPIDLDVAGVRDLIISVTHGPELDTGDFVDLVDARVVK
jgi:hypothetical protein